MYALSYCDGHDTNLRVEPELLRELKENLSAVDCLDFPFWQGWIEPNIIIL